MEKRKKRFIKDIPAFLFLLMFWRVLPTKIAALIAGKQAESATMGILVIFCIITYLWHLISRLHGKIPGGQALLVPLSGLIIIGTSVLINQNEWNTLYLTYYVRYVFFTLFFLLGVKDYNYLVETFCRFALITFLILGLQPLMTSNIFDNYMDYGFSVALPCTLGFYCMAKRKGKIIYWFLTVASIFLTLSFANRSSWLCIILFIALYELIIEEGTLKKLAFILGGSVVVFFIASNLGSILEWIISLNSRFNYNARSLLKIEQYLNGASNDTFWSGRQGLSNIALNQIRENFPFGLGIGYYESKLGTYTHNIALDFILDWGFFGVVLGIILLVGIFRSTFKESDKTVKIFKIIMLCLWFPKLFFSGSFTYEIAFWTGITMFVREAKIRRTVTDPRLNRKVRSEKQNG